MYRAKGPFDQNGPAQIAATSARPATSWRVIVAMRWPAYWVAWRVSSEIGIEPWPSTCDGP
jgi:hypothetical protein